MPELFEQVRHLFENDDGSLPDIFVDNLTDGEVVTVYNWVVSIGGIQNIESMELWSHDAEDNLPYEDVDNPAQKFVDGKLSIFHICLDKLVIEDVEIPQLGVFVEPQRIAFDYRMGKQWGKKEVNALFEFFYRIMQMAPAAVLFQADDGFADKPNGEFYEAFDHYKNSKSSGS